MPLPSYLNLQCRSGTFKVPIRSSEACASLGFVVIHMFLLLWSTGGIIEMTSIGVPWTPYTNLNFPNWLLPIHWGSVIITSAGFLIGYFTKWSGTPKFMLAAYTMLFTICVIETFGFMTSSTKHIAMIAELVTYTIILNMLFKNKYFIKYFR